MQSTLYRTSLLLFFLSFSLINFSNLEAQSSTDFYDTGKIQNISITFPQNNWRYMLDSLRYNGEELLSATILVNGKSFSNAGVRYRDGASFTPGGRRNNLFIDLDTKTDEKYADVGEIELSGATRDPSMVREVIGFEIARKYFPAPMANFAKVKINNEYYGLLVNVEVVNKDFLSENFGTTNGDLFYAEPVALEKEVDCSNNVFGTLRKDKSIDCLHFNFSKYQGDWNDLFELTKVLKEQPEKIDEVLDVDQVLWMLAYNNVFLNLKSYSGKYSYNYYLARPENGRFVTLLGKMNLSFGSYKNTGVGSDLKLEQLTRLSSTLHESNIEKPLISVLLSNETYRKQYISHISTILKDVKKYNFKRRIDALHALIYPDFVNDKNRYYSTQDLGNSIEQTIGKRSKIPGLVKIVLERRSFLKKEKELTVIPPGVTKISYEKRKQFSNEKVRTFKIKAVTDNYAKSVFIHYRYDKSGTFKTMKLKDDGKHFDDAANDKIFGIELMPNSGQSPLEYYMTVENANAIGFYPENYRQQKIKITLAELNN